jgi:hypothetical protein
MSGLGSIREPLLPSDAFRRRHRVERLQALGIHILHRGVVDLHLLRVTVSLAPAWAGATDLASGGVGEGGPCGDGVEAIQLMLAC